MIFTDPTEGLRWVLKKNMQIDGVWCASSLKWPLFREILGENPADIHLWPPISGLVGVMNILNGIARGGSPCVWAPPSLAAEERMLWERSTCAECMKMCCFGGKNSIVRVLTADSESSENYVVIQSKVARNTCHKREWAERSLRTNGTEWRDELRTWNCMTLKLHTIINQRLKVVYIRGTVPHPCSGQKLLYSGPTPSSLYAALCGQPMSKASQWPGIYQLAFINN